MSDQSTTDEKRAGSTRREFLGVVVIGALGVTTWKILDASVQFARPRVVANEFGGVFTIGTLDDLPALGEEPVNYPEGRFYLVRTAAGISAMHKVCTHLDCLFNWDQQAQSFVCPCHGSQFAVDGSVLNGPATRSLDQFIVMLATPDGDIIAETPPEPGAALALPGRGGPADESLGAIETGVGMPAAEAAGTEEEEEGEEEDGLDLRVLVDTGRKIEGTTPELVAS